MMTRCTSLIHSRCVVMLLVLFLLLSFFPVYALAENTEDNFTEELILTGEFEGTFELSQNKSKLFHLENIIPGDSWSGKIIIKNDAPEAMTARLISINSNLEDNALFNALELMIRDGNTVIYTGSYNTGKSPLTETYELASGETLVLDVTVSLPLDAGNEIMNKKMDSTWVFESLYTLGADKPHTGANLITGNSTGIFVLWIALFALIAVVITALRIRAVKKQKNL